MKLNDVMRPGLLARMDMTGRKLYHEMGYRGQGMVVCVIDTGVVEHGELQGKLVGTAAPEAIHGKIMGHGTWCATLVAGENIGAAPGAKILPYARKDVYLESVVEGLKYARGWRGPAGERVNIVSLSVSSKQNYAGLSEEVKRCWDAGILIVCSTGNDGIQDVTFPASLSETLAVGAATPAMQPVGWNTWGSMMDVIQLGENVVVGSHTDPADYLYQTGTSFAAPVVAGICALLGCRYLAQNGKYPTPAWLIETARFLAIDVGVKGPDNKSGAGFLTLDPRMPALIEMQVGNRTMHINGISTQLDQPPVIDKDTWRTLVPVRAVSEAFGADVTWDPDAQRIYIEGVRRMEAVR